MRRTVTINDTLYNEVQKVRASFIKTGQEMSFTTAINMVLLGGLVGTSKFTPEEWSIVADFLKEESTSLELEAARNQIMQILIESVGKKKRR